MGFGGFLLGLLLMAGVLGIVYLVTTGTFNNIINLSGDTGRVPQPIVGAASSVPSPIRQPTATATPVSATTAPTEQPTDAPTAEVPTTAVPNLVGLNAQQAQIEVTNAHLRAQQDTPRYSDTISAGLVLDQFPLPQTTITQTSLITYALSLGPQAVPIPDVTSYSLDTAISVLQQAGFQVTVQQEPSDTLDKGFVIRTEPRPPARPPRGSAITIIVSAGDLVTMPDVTGLSEADAKQRIASAGLTWVYSDPQSCSKLGDLCKRYGPNTVVSSIPRGGDMVKRGSQVTLGIRAP